MPKLAYSWGTHVGWVNDHSGPSLEVVTGLTSLQVLLPSKQDVKVGMKLYLSQGSKVISDHLPVDLAQCWVEIELHLEVGG